MGEELNSSKIKSGHNWKSWLKEGTFYIHGFVYMLVRIAVNVTMTVQPFYLNSVTGFTATDLNPTPVPLATVPLLSYIFSMVFSIYLQQPMTRYLRNRIYPMGVSVIVIAITSLPLAFLNSGWSANLVYPLAAI